MDANRFEGLAKAFSTSGTRRGILRLFTALPLAGGLLTLLTPRRTHGQGNGAVIGDRGHRQARRDRGRDEGAGVSGSSFFLPP
jgi:hypothetical protein